MTHLNRKLDALIVAPEEVRWPGEGRVVAEGTTLFYGDGANIAINVKPEKGVQFLN